MKKFSFLFVLILIVACSKSERSTQLYLKEPFIHTAYFWLNDGLSKGEIESFIKDCEKLKEIETVQAFYTGKPAPTNRDVIENTYDYAIVFHFNDLAGQEYYQQHPLHLEMIEKHQSKWERVLVTDIENR